ncbi:hypothetical protein [Streptomyces sp. NPDC101150]|uniref:hypothetical protein n=1 Tax=Streptomyces sp. NPDC101150 TaxID=3366114 RepID=UPI0038152658
MASRHGGGAFPARPRNGDRRETGDRTAHDAAHPFPRRAASHPVPPRASDGIEDGGKPDVRPHPDW